MWHFPEGYVIIQIEGLCTARFLKRVTESGIRVSNVCRVGDASIRFSIPARRFFTLRRLRKGLPLRIRIVKRGGLPFLLRKVWRRPVLWLGTSILFLTILVLSSRIWVIRIGETKQVDPEEIRTILSEHGLYPGAAVRGPILITAANDLSAQVHGASWIWLEREGVMLKVNVKESLPASAKRSARVPSDVVAQKDGVITSVQLMRGQAKVKTGDRVFTGDVLVSGTVFYKDSSYETGADAVVRAAVVYRGEAEVPERITECYETDASESVRVLKAAGFELYRTEPSFERYRLIGSRTIGISGLFPVEIEVFTAREIGFREVALSAEEAEQYALTLARERAYQAVPVDAAVLHTYGTIETIGNRRVAVVIVTAEEIIGKTEEEPHDG